MAAAGASGLYVNPNTGAAQAGLIPFRNALINGDMRINQRGTSTNLASMTAVATADPGSWAVDRWNVYRSTFGSGATMAQGTNLTISDLPFKEAGIKNFIRAQRVSGNTSLNAVRLAYNLESQDCTRFIGKTVTLSAYIRTGANYSSTATRMVLISGTGIDEAQRTGFTNETNITDIYGTTVKFLENSATWIRVYTTYILPSNINQLGVLFYMVPTGTAGAADYFDITGVQLELGSVATPFEVRPYPVELQLCQRYLCAFKSTSTKYISLGLAVGQSAFITRAIINLSVPLRSLTPTLISNGLNISWGANGAVAGTFGLRVWNGTTSIPTNVQTNAGYIIPENTTAFYFELVFASGITAGASYNLFMEVGSNFLYIDAEL